MRDLIDRQAAIEAIENGCQEWKGIFQRCEANIKNLPSAQPDIIRCKDCKYCDRGIDEDGNPFLKCLGWVYGGTQKDDFCSHAERRRQ